MNPASIPAFGAVILAGGMSSRMGRDKAWIAVDGVPLAARTLAVVRAAGAVEVYLSGRAGVDYSSLGVPVLMDRETGLGPLAGVARGLEAAAADLVLVVAVDLGQVTAETLKFLASRCGSGRGAVPLIEGRIEPLAACYPRAALSLAQRQIEARRLGMKQFVRLAVEADLVRFVEFGAEASSEFANWNTPADVTAT